MLSDRCLSVLSVTFVHCGQTVGRIKMKFSMQVGLGPWPHCVRWGPSSPSPNEVRPPIFGPYLFRPSGCIDQDVTWYGARSQHRRLIFGSCLLWPNGSMDEAGTWHGGMPRPRRLCVRWGPSPVPNGGRSRGPLPNFRSISIVAKRLDASRYHLV